MSNVRIESDSMGQVEVQADRYWGAQTQRSLQNFKIGGQRFGRPVIRAFGIVKKAAALTNDELGKLDADQDGDLIVRAADEVIDGQARRPLPARRLADRQRHAVEHERQRGDLEPRHRACGRRMGSKKPIHPNDDVNRSQSSNDVFPTVMHVAVALEIRERLIPAVAKLRGAIEKKAAAFHDIVKVGRTHLMDATPLTLGQEMSGWAAQLAFCEQQLGDSLDGLYELALGGTAVGTGLNTHPKWAAARRARDRRAARARHSSRRRTSSPRSPATRPLSRPAARCGRSPWRASRSPMTCACSAAGLAAASASCACPRTSRGAASCRARSTPRSAEALTMVCVQVFGNDAAVGFAGASGNFELNVFKPVIVHNVLESCALLADACHSFRDHCIVGIEPNRDVIAQPRREHADARDGAKRGDRLRQRRQGREARARRRTSRCGRPPPSSVS